MKKKIYSILIIIIIILSGWLYHSLVYNFKGELYKEKRMVRIDGKEKILNYDLSFKETMFLKIKVPLTSFLEKVKFNSNLIKTEKINFKRTKTYYFYIPKEIVRKNINYLNLVFSRVPEAHIDVRLHNYRKNIYNEFILFSSNNHLFKLNKSKAEMVFLIIIFIIIFIFLRFLLKNIFVFGLDKIYKYIFLILLPANILLVLSYFLPQILNFRIIISRGYFFTQEIGWGFLMFVGIIIKNIAVLRKSEIREETFSPFWRRRFKKIYRWVAGREFSDKCVLAFMALLIFCALFLTLHVKPVAEQLANIAYFALCMGVGIKFIKMVRVDQKGGDD